MLEDLANIGEFIAGLSVVLSLVFIAYQLTLSGKQQRANALQQRTDSRIKIWSDKRDVKALSSARSAMFEDELYRKDVRLHELEELSRDEQVALQLDLQIEIVYFNNLFYQRENGLLEPEQGKPMDYMLIFRDAPLRREWKDFYRVLDHFPADYIRHVDRIVKLYDEVERRMEGDENADYNATMQEVFDIPAPPSWLESD